MLVVFGSGSSGTLVLGGIHGNEPNAAGTAAALILFLRANPAVWADHPVSVLASANPDGLARGIRTNARKIDLNRNFAASNWVAGRWKGPYFGGENAVSEPETRAITQLIETAAPRCVISIHSISGPPCDNWDGPGESLARAMSACNGYPVKASIGYPTPGSLGSWAGIDRGIPILTLELPRNLPTQACWQQNRQALLAVISATVPAVPASARVPEQPRAQWPSIFKGPE